MDELAVEIRTLVGDIRYKLESVAECGVVERQDIKEQLHSEIEEVYSFTSISLFQKLAAFSVNHCA